MKKKTILLFSLSLFICAFAYAEDGSNLWLRFAGGAQAAVTKSANAAGQTATLSIEELQQNWTGVPVHLNLNETLTDLKDGYKITGGGSQITISAGQEIGLLYGAYHLLRLQQTGVGVANLNIEEIPVYSHRMLNHWDNLSGTIERGYAGRSIWNWSELPNTVSARYKTYARANASIGINAAVLNNVNSTADIFKTEYLNKIKALADVFRPYGIKVYVSLYFTTPMKLGGLSTADPLNQGVIDWWTNKTNEIYTLIPDFGGFLVKANSEGQPGPQDYGRTHADGANMLAKILKPHNGMVVWRAFVYGNTSAERSAQAYLEFKDLDGAFDDNVVIQIKNGPLDFQPREPFSVLFGAMEHTKLGLEVQITQEYLGASNHLAYLAPLWKEVLDADTYQYGAGSTVLKKIEESSLIAGVSNIGESAEWCGQHFGQANWYAFGRLAWNPHLSSAEIAEEWLAQTFTTNPAFITPVKEIMLNSREAIVNYMMPLGLNHIMYDAHHYGPKPWGRTDYHKANSSTLGLSRSVAAAQYNEPLASTYGNIATCPEEYLLWFHSASWNRQMSNGKTLWDALCYKYEEGVTQAAGFRDAWKGLSSYVDEQRFNAVLTKLELQAEEAIWWKNACLLYFQTFHNKPFPEGVSAPVYNLNDLKDVKFTQGSTSGCPSVQEVYNLVISKKNALPPPSVPPVGYTALLTNPSFELTTGNAPLTGRAGFLPYGWEHTVIYQGSNIAWDADNNSSAENTTVANLGNVYYVESESNKRTIEGDFIFGVKPTLPLDLYELYQEIPVGTGEGELPPGEYIVSCRLAVFGNANNTGKRFRNQRLFATTGAANNKVQYYGRMSDYTDCLTDGEDATYANWICSSAVTTDDYRPLSVTITVTDGETLRLGIKTSDRGKDGQATGASDIGWFKADAFRLTKKTDYTDKIVNPSFEQNAAGNLGGAIPETDHVVRYVPYGWTHQIVKEYDAETGEPVVLDWTASAQQGLGQSVGVNRGNAPTTILGGYERGWFSFWVSTTTLPEYTLYQDITGLPVGKYRVSCLMGGVDDANKRKTQRLFANGQVQFYGVEGDYNLENQLTREEKAKLAAGQLTVNYAGYAPAASVFYPMSVDIAIAEGEILRLGAKTSGIDTNGQPSGSSRGSVRLDDFRLELLEDGLTALAGAEEAPFTVIGQKGSLTLRLQDAAQVKIVSLSGQTVYSAKASGDLQVKLPVGLYIVHVADKVAKVLVK